MRLPALLTSDLHFVADPACEYRFALFPWLHRICKEERIKTLCILGDLVDRKDNHPAVLVNRIADAFEWLHADTGVEIVIMTGNHDWLKEGEEFFKFLRHIDGVSYVTEPWEHPDTQGPLAMFLPFSKHPMEAWKNLTSLEMYEYVFMHQTVAGSVASNGQHMPGEELPDIFDGVNQIYSGDIHVPQVVQTPERIRVEYVGSPYHVHFGDNFTPRVVLLENNGNPVDLHVPDMPRRITVRARTLKELGAALKPTRSGDQVKIRLELTPEDRHAWSQLRRDALDMARWIGLQPHGIELVAIGGDGRRITHDRAQRLTRIDPEEALSRYVEDEELGGDALQIGMELL